MFLLFCLLAIEQYLIFVVDFMLTGFLYKNESEINMLMRNRQIH